MNVAAEIEVYNKAQRNTDCKCCCGELNEDLTSTEV